MIAVATAPDTRTAAAPCAICRAPGDAAGAHAAALAVGNAALERGPAWLDAFWFAVARRAAGRQGPPCLDCAQRLIRCLPATAPRGAVAAQSAAVPLGDRPDAVAVPLRDYLALVARAERWVAARLADPDAPLPTLRALARALHIDTGLALQLIEDSQRLAYNVGIATGAGHHVSARRGDYTVESLD